MSKIECARCDREVAESKTEIIEYVTYCVNCAKQLRQVEKEKKQKAKQEEHNKIREREYIEKEIKAITEKDTKHILVTTTNNIEVKRIGEYINVISVQEYKYNPYIAEEDGRDEKTVAEKDNRECMEKALFKIKKQAYLLGADAVIGIRIYSNFDYDTKGGKIFAIMTKINISGTAVRLI